VIEASTIWLSTLVLIIIFFIYIALLCYEYVHIRLNEKVISAQKDIAAIIIINRDWYDFFSIYFQGISWFVRSLKKGSFRIFRNIDCEKFVEIIKSPQYTKFYIFGHGWIGGIHFPKGIKLIYNDIDTKRKAKFVGQYHCNHGKGFH